MSAKYLLLLTFSIFVAGVTCAQPIVRKLAPDVYYYYGDELQQKSANCTWIIFNEYVLAIDANYPWGAEEIITEIRKTTNKPIRYVFNTHYHHDHTFGNDVFVKQGATAIATDAAALEMRTLGSFEWEHRSDYSGRNMSSYSRGLPVLTFSDSLIFDDGTHRVELIRMGPAHTWGDGVAYLPKEKIVVTGDLFVNGNPWSNNVADEHANYDRWLQVLDTLASWNARIIIPGHGEPSDVAGLKNQRAYLADLFKQVRDGIIEGKSKEELRKTIDLSKHPVYGSNKKAIHRSIGELYDRIVGK